MARAGLRDGIFEWIQCLSRVETGINDLRGENGHRAEKDERQRTACVKRATMVLAYETAKSRA